MRDPREWDETYLYNLPVGEFDWLEVKGRRGADVSVPGVDENDVRQMLSKAISAFANSGGGQLVLGLTNPTKNVWKVDDGGISLDAKRPTTKEWLEDVIPNLVEAPLAKFNVYTIQRSDPSSLISPGRAVFIVDIPSSEQAPHQAQDNCYYGRVGGKSKPLGHRFVLDILGRSRHPNMAMQLSIKARSYFPRVPYAVLQFGARSPKPERIREVFARCRAHNTGRVLARYVHCQLHLPLDLCKERHDPIDKERVVSVDGIKYVVWNKQNTQQDILKAEAMSPTEYGSSWFDPILPGLGRSWKVRLRSDLKPDEISGHLLLWEVYADNAPAQSGSINLRDVKFDEEEE